MKYILLRQCANVFNNYRHHCVLIFFNAIVSIEPRKKLNKIHYKNQEIWLEPGVFLFFSSTEPHIVLILFLYFCFKFRLSYSICQNFVHQLLKLHLTL